MLLFTPTLPLAGVCINSQRKAILYCLVSPNASRLIPGQRRATDLIIIMLISRTLSNTFSNNIAQKFDAIAHST